MSAGDFSFTFFAAIPADRRRESGLTCRKRSISGTSRGWGESWSVASMVADKKVRETFPGKPIDRKEYHAFVEKTAGTCNSERNSLLMRNPAARVATLQSIPGTRTENGRFPIEFQDPTGSHTPG